LTYCLESVLSQDYTDFKVIVLDNASTDDTQAVVRSFSDPRLTYLRNNNNIGQLLNWNRAIALNTSPYLNIFHDDDVMLSGFIRKSVQLLDENPSAAFSCTLARNIDINGNPLGIEGMLERPTGLIKGMDFLYSIASGSGNPIPPSSVTMQASALALVGSFDTPHNRYMIDRNLYYRMARHFDIAHIREELVQLRCHEAQARELHLLSTEGKLQLAATSERIDVIAYLLTSDRAKDASYREWLQERLMLLNARHSECLHNFVSDIYWTWTEKLDMAVREVAMLIPPEEKIILVDDAKWDPKVFENYHVIPCLEREGQYWGAPPDGRTAIKEVERLRQLGAGFMVFGWPGFWWLEYYSGLREYLSRKYCCVLENSRLIVFDLR
jgi:glycosyltransferase involved in cell wall biosynthesis